MLITLDEAKAYLRIDFSDEDQLILSLIHSATRLVYDVIRRPDDSLTGDEYDLVHIAILYAIAYLYENRESPNYKTLTKTLRALLFGIRRESF